MFEWINESVRVENLEFSISKSSKETWDSIKGKATKATSRLKDVDVEGGLAKLKTYLDPNKAKLPVDFTAAASQVFGLEKEKIGLSGDATDTLFPYHIMVNQDFQIVQVGKDLPAMLQTSQNALLGQNLANVLLLRRPTGMSWNWNSIATLQDSSFELEPVTKQGRPPISCRATLLHVSKSTASPLVMLILTPKAHTFQDLQDMNLSHPTLGTTCLCLKGRQRMPQIKLFRNTISN